jgi:hypothetical protein
MLKVGHKSIIIVVALFLLCTCIDPYSPKLKGYSSLLVVDGLITDANTSYTVKLSRTFQAQNSTPSWVSDAIVFITDDAGANSNLINRGSGIYTTDSTLYMGVPGRTYVLNIKTIDGAEYESDACLMQSVPDIDSIYFAKDDQVINNETQTEEGVEIYLDSKEGDNNQYYRWDFDETWKFKVPDPKKFNFNMADSAITAVTDVREFCWKSQKSSEILIYSNYSGQAAPIKKEPINFIATDQSDRLLIQYSILVNQYSISKEEYDFWNNLKQVNESGGDIFAEQPFTVLSNIHNVSDPTERVLGYFQVSAAKQKRKYITFSEIVGMNLPIYQYQCERLVKDPTDIPHGYESPPPTWDELYSMYCITSDYYFVEPQYSGGTNNLEKMVFARPECADCTITGTITKPDFWVDLN